MNRFYRIGCIISLLFLLGAGVATAQNGVRVVTKTKQAVKGVQKSGEQVARQARQASRATAPKIPAAPLPSVTPQSPNHSAPANAASSKTATRSRQTLPTPAHAEPMLDKNLLRPSVSATERARREAILSQLENKAAASATAAENSATAAGEGNGGGAGKPPQPPIEEELLDEEMPDGLPENMIISVPDQMLTLRQILDRYEPAWEQLLTARLSAKQIDAVKETILQTDRAFFEIKNGPPYVYS